MVSALALVWGGREAACCVASCCEAARTPADSRVFVVSSASASARSIGAMAQSEWAAWSVEEERMRCFFLSMHLSQRIFSGHCLIAKSLSDLIVVDGRAAAAGAGVDARVRFSAVRRFSAASRRRFVEEDVRNGGVGE